MSDSSIRTQAQKPSSTIQFRCGQCDRLLRSGAMYAGQEAKCPQCGHVMRIPAAETAEGAGESPPPEPPPTASVPKNDPPIGPPPLNEPSPPQSPGTSPFGEIGAPSPTPPAGGRAPVTSPPPEESPLARGRAKSNRLPGLSTAEGISGRSSPVKQLFDRVMEQVRKLYVGQDELVLGTLVALFSGGHVLIESFPGLGKTLFVRTLSQILGCKFGRIQFTADLMPSDITGGPIFDMKSQEFRFRPGPVFTQLLLADEINRSPAKTHAALLEIMQEYHVTVDNTTHVIEQPFLVMATQNPIESEGTYNLPEAQLDRFMFKLYVDYPQAEEEADILRMHATRENLDKRLAEQLQTVTSPEEIIRVTEECDDVRIDERLLDYINSLVRLTRQWPQFHLGASPRAGLALMQGARTLAAFRGRDYAVPDDVVELALPVMRHRVILTAEAEVEGREVDELLTELVRTVEVPRL